jgi:hypothetical protein
MDTLWEYTKDIEELQDSICKEQDPDKKAYLETQLDFLMELFSEKVIYRRDAMDLAKEAIEDQLVQASKGGL